jgi:hypothetical protein
MAKKDKKLSKILRKIKKNNVNKKKIFLIISLIIIIIIFLLNNLIITRYILPRQIDDFNPNIPCEKELIDKSEILMVIPLYLDVPISQNKTWCDSILALNKTLAMHGVYHTYNEFLEVRNESYISIGRGEFKKCFGFYPKYFEAPQLALNKENIAMIESLNMTVLHYKHNLFHKVYHCNNTGLASNGFIEIF